MMNREALSAAAAALARSSHAIALTGAGISVESGIPDFRSEGGLWERFNPAEYATADALRRTPEKVWRLVLAMAETIKAARPNPAHAAMAGMERGGLLKMTVTQNIDNLHQEAGSVNVVEFHGNGRRFYCCKCGQNFSPAEIERLVADSIPPYCLCGGLIRPDVVFFGEAIPLGALRKSFEAAEKCDACLVVGTSAEIYPAASIPAVAKDRGAVIIEANVGPTGMTAGITDILLQGKASETLSALLDEVTK